MTDSTESTENRVKPLGPVDIAAPFGDDPARFLEEAEGGEVQAIASGWRLALREFADNKIAVLGVAILVFFVLFCFIGPLVYHTNQTLTQPLNANLTPGQASPLSGQTYPLGTDEHGFDELGRIMLGGQTALEIGFFAALISIVIGTLYGAISGLSGRLLDGVMMRFVDIVYSIPFLFIVLVLGDQVQRDRARGEPVARLLLVAGAGATDARRGTDAARAGLRVGRRA